MSIKIPLEYLDPHIESLILDRLALENLAGMAGTDAEVARESWRSRLLCRSWRNHEAGERCPECCTTGAARVGEAIEVYR